MTGDNDRRVLTDRVGRSFDRADSAPQRRDGTPAFAGQVYDGGAMPDAVPRWYLTHPVEFDGTECEACSYTPSADTQASVPVIVLHHVPSVGDILIAELIGGRWVAEEGAGGAHGCTCMTTICVTGCPAGAELVGATVTVKQGTTTIATCTTADDGHGHACCSVCLDAGGGAGAYEVIVSADGYVTFDATLTLACGGTTPVRLQQSGYPPCQVQVSVEGCACAGNMEGVTVTIGGQVFTTQLQGYYGIYGTWTAPGPGTYTASVDVCNFKLATFDIVVTDSCGCTFSVTNEANCTVAVSGSQVTVTLVPSSGYECGANGPYPEPATLHLTDSIYGSCTLTYDGGSGTWKGSIAGLSYAAHDYGGGGNCPASTGFTIHYTLGSCGSLTTSYDAVYCGSCAAGFFTQNAGNVPQDAPGTSPCTDGDPATGCSGSLDCTQTFTVAWGNAANFVCPMDAVWSFGSTGLTPPTSASTDAIWTSFGPGTITVTE